MRPIRSTLPTVYLYSSLWLCHTVMVVFGANHWLLRPGWAQQAEPQSSAPSGIRADGAGPVEALRAKLRSDDPLERYRALQEASEPSQPAERAAMVTLLIATLDDPVPDVRATAADALGFFGTEAQPAIPTLLSRLADDGVTLAARGVWTHMSQALGRIGPATIDPLLQKIEGSEVQVYSGIMGALAEMKADARRVVPRLIELLRTVPEERRWATMYAMHAIGKDLEPAIPDLIAQLDHENFNLQVMACRTLSVIGPPAQAAAPKLVELTNERLISTRTHAAMCLAALGPIEGIDTIGILSNILHESNQISRERAMIGLASLGAAAKDALPIVDQALRDTEFFPQPEAARAWWKISGDADRAVARLKLLLDSPTYDIRALEILAELGPAALAAAEKLAPRLQDEDQGIRLLAAQVFAAMGPAAKDYRPALEARLADSDRDVVAVLRLALARMGDSRDSPAKTAE